MGWVDSDADETFEERTLTRFLIDPHNFTGYAQVLRETHTDADGISDVANRFAFTGRQLDSTVGMYCFRHRLYHADTGAFQTRDPITYKGSDYNLYEYVKSNPLNELDPLGLVRLRKFYFDDQIACDPVGAKLGRHTTYSKFYANCTKTGGPIKVTHHHSTSTTVTVGGEVGGEVGGDKGKVGGKFSRSVATGHTDGESIEFEVPCCSARKWFYTFECQCIKHPRGSIFFVNPFEVYDGSVDCKLVGEGLVPAPLSSACPNGCSD